MDWLKTGSRLRQGLKKYRWAALVVLLGIGLMLIPGRSEAEKTAQPASTEPQPDPEQRLTEILTRIEGVGTVQVLLTWASGEETVYQTDEDLGTGGDARRNTVVITDGNRNQQGLVRQVNPGACLGAIVVCQGGDSPAVRLAVKEAVASVTGLGADRISVWKMG